MTRKEINDFIEEHETRILSDLQNLISFESVVGNKDENERCLNWFMDLARSMNLTTFRTTTNDVGIVEVGEGDETLGVLVHLDVVSIGDPRKWTFSPFEGMIYDGSIYGRGTLDDKGAAIISLYALKALVDLEVPLHKKIWLIIGTSEEGKWTDIQNFKSEFPIPNYGFSPDGEFPIFNIEKGYADITLNFRESCNGKTSMISELKAGKDTNTIPSRAEIVYNGKLSVFEGVSAHSSTPEVGINAIEKLCMCKIINLNFKFVRFMNEILGQDMYGGRLTFKGNEDYWGDQYVGKTTVVPTVLGIRDGKVQLTLNVRHSYGVTRENIHKAFEEFAKEYDYDIKMEEYMDPMVVSKELGMLSLMAQVYESWGFTNSFGVDKGTSYAKAMENFVSWGPSFPGDPPCAHQENERIPLKSLFLAMGIYMEFLSRAVSTKESLK